MKLLTAQEVAALSPQERKARIVESYVRSAEAVGQRADAAAIEAMVVADCNYVDRAGASITPRPRKPAAPRPQQPIKHVEGTHAPTGQAVRIKQLHANPFSVSPKWAMAAARVARICDHASSGASIGDVDNAEVPRLAKECAFEWMYIMTKDRPAPIRGVDHNPYRGMSDVDAGNAYEARIMAICDRSTGRFGPWWVR